MGAREQRVWCVYNGGVATRCHGTPPTPFSLTELVNGAEWTGCGCCIQQPLSEQPETRHFDWYRLISLDRFPRAPLSYLTWILLYARRLNAFESTPLACFLFLIGGQFVTKFADGPIEGSVSEIICLKDKDARLRLGLDHLGPWHWALTLGLGPVSFGEVVWENAGPGREQSREKRLFSLKSVFVGRSSRIRSFESFYEVWRRDGKCSWSLGPWRVRYTEEFLDTPLPVSVFSFTSLCFVVNITSG